MQVTDEPVRVIGLRCETCSKREYFPLIMRGRHQKDRRKYKKIKKFKIYMTFCPLPPVINGKREIVGGKEMDNRKMPTIEELQEMAAVDIRNVDKSTLVDLDDVEIHTELPLEERIADYIRQVKNPYCHISNGMIVKISFAGQDTLEACLSRCISPEKKF